jgi:hypothetical protein
MNRAEENTLGWLLIDAAKPVLPRNRLQWLHVTLGAGEQVEAINELLNVLARHEVQISEELWEPLWSWVSGYVGSDGESRLRKVLAELQVPEPRRFQAPDLVPVSDSFGWRPRRVRQSFARTVAPSRMTCLDPALSLEPVAQ